MFERCFVAEAVKLGTEEFGSVMAFAKKIWPEKDDKTAAQTLYNTAQKSSKTGKPQSLKLAEAIRIAELLSKNVHFSAFFYTISIKIDNGWIENNDESQDLSKSQIFKEGISTHKKEELRQ